MKKTHQPTTQIGFTFGALPKRARSKVPSTVQRDKAPPPHKTARVRPEKSR